MFIQVIVFSVEPSQQQSLADELTAELDRWVPDLPGFVSATFHLSVDGTRVLNYATWATEEAFQAFTQDSRGEAIGQIIRAHRLTAPPDIHAYRVHRTLTSRFSA